MHIFINLTPLGMTKYVVFFCLGASEEKLTSHSNQNNYLYCLTFQPLLDATNTRMELKQRKLAKKSAALYRTAFR